MTLQDRPATAKYKLTGADYALLAAAGAFGDARTELVDGDVLLMSPQYRPHGFVKDELAFALRLSLRQLESSLAVATEVSVSLSEHDMPAPDIALTTEPRGAGAMPLASLMLAIEVSDTTLEHDLGRKAELYAGAAIPEYWVADVNGRVIHQFWRPADGVYAEQRTTAFGEPLKAVTIPDLEIATTAL